MGPKFLLKLFKECSHLSITKVFFTTLLKFISLCVFSYFKTLHHDKLAVFGLEICIMHYRCRCTHMNISEYILEEFVNVIWQNVSKLSARPYQSNKLFYSLMRPFKHEMKTFFSLILQKYSPILHFKWMENKRGWLEISKMLRILIIVLSWIY